MRQAQYEKASDDLNEVYQMAYDRLMRRHVMDDEAKSLLVTVTLKSYFDSELVGSVDLQAIAETVVAAFEI